MVISRVSIIINLINLINLNGITVHTIAVPNVLGNIPVVNYNRLNNIAYYTGGTFNTIWNFPELFWEFARTDMTDTDNDGISDYHEQAIADGRILQGNGRPIPYAHLLNYRNPDSDGDGLLDGQEIEVRFTMTEDKRSLAFVYAWSYPTLVDSDFDGIPDKYDFAPLNIRNNHDFIFYWSTPRDIAYRKPEAVEPLQRALVHLGFLCMYDRSTGEPIPFGGYGGITRGAVVDFQLNHGFEPTGLMDPHTYAAIINSWAKHLAADYGHSMDWAATFFEQNATYLLQQPELTARPIPFKSGLVNLAPVVPESMREQGVIVASYDIGRVWYFFDYTVPLNALMLQNMQIALDHMHNTSDWFSRRHEVWFGFRVWNDGMWDVKRPHHWETQLPGITFLTLNGTFLFRGRLTDAEAYGNIHFAYIGTAMGFDRDQLHRGAGFAAEGVDDAHDGPFIDRGIQYFYDDHM